MVEAFAWRSLRPFCGVTGGTGALCTYSCLVSLGNGGGKLVAKWTKGQLILVLHSEGLRLAT